jgi:glutathione S-transferase
MTLKFYMTPGSCTTGIHILLEELELPFEVTIVNMPAGDHRRPEYLSLNPKGSIPTLVLDDGQALTEFQAIACWLARRYPRRRLLSDDPLLAARAIELMDYVAGTVHGQGYTRIFTTDRYLPPGLPEADGAAWLPAIQARGREIVAEAFAIIELSLPEAGYAVGGEFSVADAALFYVEFWADKTGMALPPRCAAHYQLVKARPVVQRVLREEGYR